MTAQLIDGRKIAENLKADVALEVKQLETEGITCGLATVAVGDDYSAKAYERRLGRIAAELGVPCQHIGLSAHIREGAVVLDVGINPVPDRQTEALRMVGDVAFDDVAPRARAITPVPGGIGPVTDVWLLRNTVTAARNAAGTGGTTRRKTS
jgi:5,10-methylene-tetrahydrofolate dehydrogenase/methenyl tetrahydrofolate cyclohydrolase